MSVCPKLIVPLQIDLAMEVRRYLFGRSANQRPAWVTIGAGRSGDRGTRRMDCQRSSAVIGLLGHEGSLPVGSVQPAIVAIMWFMTSPCSACGLKRITSASSTTRTLCPGGQ